MISQENHLPDILFVNPFPRKHLDLESEKSGFSFDPKYPPRVLILCIHDWFLDFTKKTTKSVFGFKNLFSDFPKKMHH